MYIYIYIYYILSIFSILHGLREVWSGGVGGLWGVLPSVEFARAGQGAWTGLREVQSQSATLTALHISQ